MKRRIVLLIAVGLMIFAPVNLLASDLRVIANPSVKIDTISASDLKHIFLEEKISLGDGTHVEPVLEKDGPTHSAFLQDFLGMSEDDLETYYRTLLFTGRGSQPKALGSDAAVVAYVARTRGAIGYVSSMASVNGVKTLSIGSGNTGDRNLITRVEPVYPETLKLLDIRGTVRLRISISAKGNVEHVEMLGGNPILGESAIAAVEKWIYAAGRSQTQAVISITFGP
jgi:TonB family protein